MIKTEYKIDINNNDNDEINCILHENWYNNHNSELMSILYNDSIIFQSMNYNRNISEYLTRIYRQN